MEHVQYRKSRSTFAGLLLCSEFRSFFEEGDVAESLVNGLNTDNKYLFSCKFWWAKQLSTQQCWDAVVVVKYKSNGDSTHPSGRQSTYWMWRSPASSAASCLSRSLRLTDRWRLAQWGGWDYSRGPLGWWFWTSPNRIFSYCAVVLQDNCRIQRPVAQ